MLHTMLATVDALITDITAWLPSGLQPWAQILIYFVILAVMSAVPIAVCVGYLLSTTRRAKAS